jgi:hypothetical protein
MGGVVVVVVSRFLKLWPVDMSGGSSRKLGHLVTIGNKLDPFLLEHCAVNGQPRGVIGAVSLSVS